MRTPPLTVALAALAITAAACAGSTSSASQGDAPLPTIGLGSEIGEGGQVSGRADVRSVGTTSVDSVVMIGDSITVASEAALERAFEQLGFDNVLIQAQEGKRTALSFGSNPSGADVAGNVVNLIENVEPEPGATDDPFDHSNELWIVALGTNDIDQYSDPAERAAAINEMLAAVPDESPLIWVDTYFRDRPDATDELNATIIDRVGQRENTLIAEWSTVADDDGNLRSDGVHPREQGSEVFANVVGNAVVEMLELR